MRTYRLLVIYIILYATCVFSQENLINKNDIMLTGSGSFSSLGGDYYVGSDNNRVTYFNISPSINYFVMDYVFVGGGLNYTRISNDDESITSLSVGPNIGLLLSRLEHMYPYLSSGFRYNSNSVGGASGTMISFGGGLMAVSERKIGISVEVLYNIVQLKQDGDTGSKSGNIISFGCGIAGFLNIFSKNN